MTTLTSLFAFKRFSDVEMVDAVKGLCDAAHAAQRHTATRILNHIRVVDEIFIGHLSGVAHGHDATNTTDTPSLGEIGAKLANAGEWYENFCKSVPYPMLGERLPFRFTDGDQGNMTREEILLHVLQHGGFHRGAVGRILVDCGKASPRELFTRYLHNTEPERRGF